MYLDVNSNGRNSGPVEDRMKKTEIKTAAG